MKNHFVLASGNITIGDHHSVWHVAGLTIYGDVVWTTLLAAAIVMAFGIAILLVITTAGGAFAGFVRSRVRAQV